MPITIEKINKFRDWILIVFITVNTIFLIQRLSSPPIIQVVMPSTDNQCACDSDDNNTSN